jgi:cytosine/adenosine deaminase-related metal-dependent hydrolase
MRRRLTTLLALLGVLARAEAQAAPRRLEGEGLLILQGATLIRGTGARPLPRSLVAIRGTRIEAVARVGEIRYPANAVVLDLSGRFLIPGLVDLNAPVLAMAGGGRPRTASPERLLEILLAHGITTIRIPVGPTARSVALREEIASGQRIGPRILTAGDEIEGADPAELAAAVRLQAASGVDLVRLGPTTPPQAVQAAIHEAHARGVQVLGVLFRTPWTRAARSGIDSVSGLTSWSEADLEPGRRERYRQARAQGGSAAHLAWLDHVDPAYPEVGVMVRWLKRRRVAVDPDLASLWAELEGAPHGPAVWPKVEALLRLYHQGGVLLTAGTGKTALERAPGASFHEELERLAAAGIPPWDVLRIATRNGAEALGLLGELGTVEPGHRADLLVLRGDPQRDIRSTRLIEIVFREGIPYSPETLLRRTPPSEEPLPDGTLVAAAGRSAR